MITVDLFMRMNGSWFWEERPDPEERIKMLPPRSRQAEEEENDQQQL